MRQQQGCCKSQSTHASHNVGCSLRVAVSLGLSLTLGQRLSAYRASSCRELCTVVCLAAARASGIGHLHRIDDTVHSRLPVV